MILIQEKDNNKSAVRVVMILKQDPCCTQRA